MSFELGRHSATAKLVELANGMRISQALYVAAELRIADLVALRPLSSKELAVATETNEHALDRVLRALCAFGVLGEQSPGHFGLTSIGRLLRSDVPAIGTMTVRLISLKHVAVACPEGPKLFSSSGRCLKPLNSERRTNRLSPTWRCS
jgi:Dimerisation domain